ncbi:hypothetical protein [Singulisphaera sp. PoT]|uniref:hypothetical protein n=1 Tax=Singulisphaera sp. PoT TaxID=3411797 RepID=UPI003BF46C6D
MPLLREDLLRNWQNYEASLAALQAEPEAWAEYQMARNSWDSALKNGSNHDRTSNADSQGRSSLGSN